MKPVWNRSALPSAIPAEGTNTGGYALVILLIALGFALVLVPLGCFIGRDAARHGRNGWGWGILFVWQPVIVGLVYLIVRRRPPGQGLSAAPGWYPDPAGTGRVRWWDGHYWTAHLYERL